MSYLTDRKRATGMGSAKSGPHHHWMMIVTSVALIPLVLCFVFIVGSALGSSHAEVVETFSNPFNALVALLTMVVGLYHFNGGVQVLIEDYVGGLARKILIIAMTCLSYGAMAAVAYALVRIAL